MLGAPHFAMEMMPKSQKLQVRTIEKKKDGDYKKDGHKLQKVGVMRLRAKTKKKRHKKAIFMPHPHKNEIARKNRRTISKK